MTQSRKHSGFFRAVDLGEVVGCLEDLITYFAQPEDDMSESGGKFRPAQAVLPDVVLK